MLRGFANLERYFEAAKLNEKLGRVMDALNCAEKGSCIDRDCLGTDHPLYEQSEKTVQKLRQKSLNHSSLQILLPVQEEA
jgi:hypothetical protein